MRSFALLWTLIVAVHCANGMANGPCTAHDDCHSNQACLNRQCINPCTNSCGVGANCETRNHVPVCSCPSGYTGHPFMECRRQRDEELCVPTPCGANTKCDVKNGVPTCSCLPGYYGKPISGCRHECEVSSDCGDQEYCDEFRCRTACNQCGKGAQCLRINNHAAVCECPKGYLGNAYTSGCQAECASDSDCPSGRPACFYGACKNLCDGVCGINADCKLRDRTPVCSCPPGMRGDPFTKCYPITADDLCNPNPCGENSKCAPGKNKEGKDRAICSCEVGYTGNAIKGCTRGECLSNDGCSLERACINYKCVDPCANQCGTGATCQPKRHLAYCSCPAGTTGDALVMCHNI